MREIHLLSKSVRKVKRMCVCMHVCRYVYFLLHKTQIFVADILVTVYLKCIYLKFIVKSMWDKTWEQKYVFLP